MSHAIQRVKPLYARPVLLLQLRTLARLARALKALTARIEARNKRLTDQAISDFRTDDEVSHG